jgi:hypothetical protein
MANDLTCVLVPAGQLDEARIHAIVVESGRAEAIVRVAPLPAVNLIQIEVHDARRGLPTEDPALVARLSKGGKAAFVHVNHSAKQALVHGFVDGEPNEGFSGDPGDEMAAKLRAEVGVELDAIAAADDGSRLGIGVAATRTTALIRGRKLAIPPGTPTALDAFTFHDRGAALEDGAERLAWLAFDRKALFEEKASVVAARIAALPPGALGPLEGARAESVALLRALGDQTIAAAQPQEVRALEVVAFAGALVFAGGDQVGYWDERVLPLFAICGVDAPPAPALDAAESEELEDDETPLLAAMVETLPFAAPPDGEGPLLSSLAAAEVHPLMPWAQAGVEHAGALFMLRPERLLTLVRALDGKRLTGAMESFAHAWYRALRPGQPEGDAYELWRKVKEETSERDIDRFLNDWAELRACLEIAAVNRLDVGMLFYA